MTGDLVVPNATDKPVPKGWAEDVAAPLLEDATWEELDEAEGRLRGLASYIESFDGDILEFEKALRMVEHRRGVLLGPDVRQGERTDLQPRTCVSEVHPKTASRYRKIARHWDEVLPHILKAEKISEVRQTCILRMIDGDTNEPEPPSGEVPKNKTDLFVWRLQNLYHQAPRRAQNKFRKWVELQETERQESRR